MTEHTGLPTIPAISADREAWIQAWRQALGAYRLMAGYPDHLTDRWTQEMAQAYLEPWYSGEPKALAEIGMTAQRLGPLHVQRETPNTPSDSIPEVRASVVEKAGQTQDTQIKSQLDFFEEFLS